MLNLGGSGPQQGYLDYLYKNLGRGYPGGETHRARQGTTIEEVPGGGRSVMVYFRSAGYLYIFRYID